VVVTGAEAFDRMWEDIVRRELQPSLQGLQFTYLSGLPLPRLLDEVARVPRDSIVLCLSVAKDGAGQLFKSPEVAQKVAAAAGAPTYTPFPNHFGSGQVGGYMNSFEAVGRRAAGIAARLLSGESLEQVRAGDGPQGAYVADWRALQRWGLRESRLPPGAEVRFRQPSLWEEHRALLIAGAALLALQGLLISALLFQRGLRRRAEAESVALAGRLLTAHEDERRHLARELHDDLTQRLARLAIDAGGLAGARDAPQAERALKSLRDDLTQISSDVHAMSYRLHPSMLEDLGLAEALKAEGDRVTRHGGPRVEIEVRDLPQPLPAEASLCLFRVAQEALNNAAHHAQAGAVKLLLAPSDGGLRLTVSDDGLGFDPDLGREDATLGLASMRERVRLLRGELDIDSAPGMGTLVLAWVPLAKGGA